MTIELVVAFIVFACEQRVLLDLSDELRAAAHDVVMAHTHARAVAAIVRGAAAVVIGPRLDDIRGTDLCRELRANDLALSATIMMVVEGTDEIDRVVAFELGADDVVAYPCSVREFGLRMAALLRRGSYGDRKTVSSSPPLVIDSSGYRVNVAGRDVMLSWLELKLLSVIHGRKGAVMRRSQLLLEVWGGRDRVSERTVDACVKRLRGKLGQAGGLIETVRGVGYRMADGFDDVTEGLAVMLRQVDNTG